MSDEDHFNTADAAAQQSEAPEAEPVWTFRGYRLGPSEFTTAMVHFFRAEVSRANVWRQRLDTTTNWAVITTGVFVSLAFSGTGGHHSVIILSALLTTLFLFIEARRYRYYELWSSRVRLMETDFFASMLVPPFHPSPDWAESLAESLLQPHFPISVWEAVGRRLRRNYLAIYAILAITWLAKIWLHPQVASSWSVMFDRGAIGPLPGWAIAMIWLIFIGVIGLFSLLTLGLHGASGEVLPRFFPGAEAETVAAGRLAGGLRAWFRPHGQRRQLLAFIITDQARQVADHILKDMNRGVTALPGMGMYTGKEHSVLMCALTITEVNQLKHIVQETDPNAFVIVSPVQEVLGKGFVPLEES